MINNSNVVYPTLSEIKSNYQSYLSSANADIDSFATNSSWDILSGSYAMSLLNLYANLRLLENAIYPQNAVGYQVDNYLYIKGLPARGSTTYSTSSCNYTGTVPVTIPAGSQFTSNETGSVYIVLSQVIITTNSQTVTLYSNIAGSGYIESIGNTLVGSSGSFNVTSSIQGQNQETDQSCINRYLVAQQQPLAGSRQSDYQNYCLQYNQTLTNPIITDSIPIVNFLITNNVSIFGIFAVSGQSQISEFQLNQGLLPSTTYISYDRSINNITLSGLNTYIQGLRLIGNAIIVGTSITNIVSSSTSPINIKVSLAPGYTLTTPISINSQDQNNNPITITLTVTQLIQREIRRSICNQPFGATNIDGNNQITISSIEQNLDSQLSYNNGQLAQILIDRVFSNTNILVPNYNFSSTNLEYCYDNSSYSDINVSSE